MPLVEITLPIEAAAMPGDVRAFLQDADRRIELFCRDSHIHGFVPSDYTAAYTALRALSATGLAPGDLFCEWGSGFGVVACLASMLGFDACGIEIEEELVEAARLLADDFGLPVEFIRGSFIPEGSDIGFEANHGYAWLVTEESSSQDDGLSPADFDTIFAYPWPDEEHIVAKLFERHAAVGAVLLTYHGGEKLRVQRKVGAKSRGKGRSRRGPG